MHEISNDGAKKKFEVFLDWGPGLNAFVLLTLPLSGSDFEAFNAG